MALVRKFLDPGALLPLRDAASAAFAAIERGEPARAPYCYNQFSGSLLLGPVCEDARLPFDACIGGAELVGLFSDALGGSARCNPDQCWLRKKYPPAIAPPRHAPNAWHQDGALGVRFPDQPGSTPPMTPLISWWVPLTPCGRLSPGLEFIRHRLDTLLHYTELNDASLRRRFEPHEFWSPELELGDALAFLNGTLHRTQISPQMREPRLSVEYRFWPPA